MLKLTDILLKLMALMLKNDELCTETGGFCIKNDD